MSCSPTTDVWPNWTMNRSGCPYSNPTILISPTGLTTSHHLGAQLRMLHTSLPGVPLRSLIAWTSSIAAVHRRLASIACCSCRRCRRGADFCRHTLLRTTNANRGSELRY